MPNPVTLKGVPNSPDHFYRSADSAAHKDFLRSGVVRSNPTGSFPAQAHYSKGAVLDAYAKPGATYGGGDYVYRAAEKGGPKFHSTGKPRPGQHASARTLQAEGNMLRTPNNTTGHVNRFTNPVEAYQRGADGAYKRVYDNATPWKRGLRSALHNVAGTQGAIAAERFADAAGKAAVPLTLATSAVDTASTPTTRYAERFAVPQPKSFAGDVALRTLGAASDLGNTLGFGLPAKYLYRDTKGK
jgi:hypothetical protein